MFRMFTDPFIDYRRVRRLLAVAAVVWGLAVFLMLQGRPQHKRVVLVVIDGLHADAVRTLEPYEAPNFYFLINTGASTFNGRTDLRSTQTLPNVASMLTGRPVYDTGNAHRYVWNEYLGRALHDVQNKYIHSIFDVLYTEGLRASFFASRDKMGLFVKSYTTENYEGKKDPSRFQSYFISDNKDGEPLDLFLRELENFDSSFIFLHLALADNIGHKHGWSLHRDSPYMKAVRKIDKDLGRMIEVIKTNKHLRNSTYLIVTSDHGGSGFSHDDFRDPDNFRVPLIVWGPGVARGADLYDLNPTDRHDPGKWKVDFGSRLQPVRAGEVGNLALDLLGLPPIPNSIMNGLHSLRVRAEKDN